MSLSEEIKQILEDTQEQLNQIYEREIIGYTTKISTLEVAIGQQSIKIKKLEEQIEQLKKDISQTDISEAYPYTHPIRPIFAYSKINRSTT